MEKLEWCGYPMEKNFDDTFGRFNSIQFISVAGS